MRNDDEMTGRNYSSVMKLTFLPLATACLSLLVANAFPALNVPLAVQEFSGVTRTGEGVRSGVPVPRHAGLLSTSDLRLLDQNGAPVPARFSVLGRWGAGPADTTAPLRWVLVDFATDVAASATNRFTLTQGGPGPALPALNIVETTTNITVTTGPARFAVSKTRGSLLEAAWLDLNGDTTFSAGEQIISPANDTGSFVVATNTEFRANNTAPLSVLVDDNGPGRATVRIEGFHRDSGTNQFLRYVTRLTFFAGQSYVHVHHTFIEGRVLGTGNGDFPAGVIISPFDRAGLRVRPSFSGALNARMTADSAALTVIALTNAAHLVAIRQRTPTNYVEGMRYEVFNNSTLLETGQRARQAWLDVGDSTWGLAASTRDFWRKGPQRLSGAGDGTLTVEFPAEPYTIYQAMGLAEEVLLDFHPASAAVADQRRRSEGSLKDPLFAVAPGAWYVASGAFGQLPAYPCTRYPRFDQILEEHFQISTQWVDAGRTFGLRNYLDMPTDRYDPATDPHEVYFSSGYYDPCTAQIHEFARRGEFRWLRDLAFPHLRHWYTVDCYDTDDPASPQNGICPAHGTAHRSNFTGEYHYMESFWDYYYLTGDRRGLERLTQGARSYATQPIWRNEADIGLLVPGLTARMICQKLNTMLEAYLATGDPLFRNTVTTDAEDFIASYGTPMGFFRFYYRAPTNDFLAGQAFQVQVIFLPLLKKYYELTGSPAAEQQLILAPQQISTYYRAATNPASPDYLLFTNYARVTTTAGTTNFTAQSIPPPGGADAVLYNESITALLGALSHAGALTYNRALIGDAQFIWTNRIQPQWFASVWDKPASQQTLRAVLSLAYLDAPETPPPSDFVGVKLLTGRFRMDHQGTLGHPYLLQSSANLSTWLTLSTNTPDASGTFSFDDTNNLSAPFRFYRVLKP